MILQAGKATTDWEEYVAPLMFSHNTAVHRATMVSPFYAMFAYSPRAPIWPGVTLMEEDEEAVPEGLDPLLHQRQMQRLIRDQARHNNQHHKDQYLAPKEARKYNTMVYEQGQLVWFRVQVPKGPNKKLWPMWEEGVVVNRLADQVYRVRRCTGSSRRAKNYKVNGEHLKPPKRGDVV